MYGALLLFESEFVHIVAISFTSLILTELLMVALTIQTWHWLMTVAELLSLACYIASLVFLHEFIGKSPAAPDAHIHLEPAHWVQGPQRGKGGGPLSTRDLGPLSSRPPHSAALLVSWASRGAQGHWQSASLLELKLVV